MTDGLYNPLDYENLTHQVVLELASQHLVTLPLQKKFKGPGVYALYYAGSIEYYTPFASPEGKYPIYVGCAEPSGGRTGGSASMASASRSESLHARIKQHEKSLEAASNLEVGDFRVRYLAVVPLWVQLAERFLITHYRPLWNVCLEGFGNHDPGKGRHQGLVSWWDTLHPGRQWVTRLRHERTSTEALARIRDFNPVRQETP